MPDFSCQLNDIGTATNCSDKAGLLFVYATLDSDVDWATMAGATYYDNPTNTILQWASNVGSNWVKFTFNRKNGRLDSTYTKDNGYYEIQLLNLLFKGKEETRTISIGQLLGCCGLILQVHDNNGLSRVIGKEFISGEWVNPLSRGQVERHLDTTGAFGSADDNNRDELDFTALNSNPLPYSAVSIADMDILVQTATVFGVGTTVFGSGGNNVFSNQ